MAASPPTGPAVPERLVAARDALGRHAWQEAFDGFHAADAETPLGGPDLEALAEAAFFTADVDVRERAYERAFKAHLTAGDPIRAAAVASSSNASPSSVAPDPIFRRPSEISAIAWRSGSVIRLPMRTPSSE